MHFGYILWCTLCGKITYFTCDVELSKDMTQVRRMRSFWKRSELNDVPVKACQTKAFIILRPPTCGASPSVYLQTFEVSINTIKVS